MTEYGTDVIWPDGARVCRREFATEAEARRFVYTYLDYHRDTPLEARFKVWQRRGGKRVVLDQTNDNVKLG